MSSISFLFWLLAFIVGTGCALHGPPDWQDRGDVLVWMFFCLLSVVSTCVLGSQFIPMLLHR